jgi:hypothetical protein
MEKMTNKLIDKINTLFQQIKDIDKQLTSCYEKDVDKSIIPEIKVLLDKSMEINGGLFILIELFLEDNKTTDLPKDVYQYYEFAQLLKKEMSNNPGDMEKLKELIKSQNEKEKL